MTEFKITGPGLYKTRAGEKIEVTHIEECFTYAVRCGEGNTEHRTINGAYYEGQEHGKDIIGPWEGPAAAEIDGRMTKMTTEFKITGPGEYRTRDGRKAVVSHNDGGRYCWLGKIGEGIYNWNENGSFWATEIISVDDIIGPWEEPATVSSVLTYAGVTKKPSEVLTWLDFVTFMNDPASTVSGSKNCESRSKDEATGNTACDEAVDALSLVLREMNPYVVYGSIALDWIISKLRHHGFSIVRTSPLGNRNGCYNTRTEKDVD